MTANQTCVEDDVIVSVLQKRDERYVIICSEWRRSEALEQVGRWASNYELSFDWGDAANMSRHIRSF